MSRLLSPHERVGGSHEGIFEGLQSGFSPQNLILKPREPRLTGSRFFSLVSGESKSPIYPYKICIIAVLIPNGNLIHSLPHHLKLRVFAVNPGPGILQFIAHGAHDAETLVSLPQKEKIHVRRDFGSRKSTMRE